MNGITGIPIVSFNLIAVPFHGMRFIGTTMNLRVFPKTGGIPAYLKSIAENNTKKHWPLKDLANPG